MWKQTYLLFGEWRLGFGPTLTHTIQLHRFHGNNYMHTTAERQNTYLWGSFDTGSMYTHSRLVKVLSIQDFWDCGKKRNSCEQKDSS